MRKALEKLEEIEGQNNTRAFVTTGGIRSILLADLAWKESVESRLPDYEARKAQIDRFCNKFDAIEKRISALENEVTCAYCGLTCDIKEWNEKHGHGKCGKKTFEQRMGEIEKVAHEHARGDINAIYYVKPSVPERAEYVSDCHKCSYNRAMGLKECSCGKQFSSTQESVTVEQLNDDGSNIYDKEKKESVTVEDNTLHNRIEDLLHTYLTTHEDYRSTHNTALMMEKLVRSHSKDMVMIPRDVAEKCINDLNKSTHAFLYKSTQDLMDAIKQSLKGQA